MKRFYFLAIYFILIQNIAFGQSQNWVPLAEEVNYYVKCLTEYKGKLIAGGGFTQAGSEPISGIAMWNGTKWSKLGLGLSKNRIDVNNLLVVDSNLYVVGYFDSAGGERVNCIAIWNGRSWSAVGSGANGPIFSIAQYKGEIYVGGGFDSIGGIYAKNIARWDGINWSSVGAGASWYTGNINKLYVFKDELYALGRFDSMGNVPCSNVARWNGTNWNNLGNGLKEYNPTMIEWRGRLLIGTQTILVSNPPDPKFVKELSQWDGDSLTLFNKDNLISINNFLVFNNELYCAGGGGVYKWDSVGTQWFRIGSDPKGYIEDLIEFKSEIYCSGWFNTAQFSNMNYIGRLRETTWFNSLTKNSVLQVYPNPTENQITIKGKKIKNMFIYDINGHLVYKQTINASEKKIDLGFLNNGLYSMMVISEDGISYRTKILIKFEP